MSWRRQPPGSLSGRPQNLPPGRRRSHAGCGSPSPWQETRNRSRGDPDAGRSGIHQFRPGNSRRVSPSCCVRCAPRPWHSPEASCSFMAMAITTISTSLCGTTRAVLTLLHPPGNLRLSCLGLFGSPRTRQYRGFRFDSRPERSPPSPQEWALRAFRDALARTTRIRPGASGSAPISRAAILAMVVDVAVVDFVFACGPHPVTVQVEHEGHSGQG